LAGEQSSSTLAEEREKDEKPVAAVKPVLALT
jgi:hypothetical protein